MKKALWLWELVKRLGVAVALFFDCTGNLIVGGSFRNTISGEAWNNRDQESWKGVYQRIDALPIIGYVGHCQHAAEREVGFGSVWAAWADKTRRVWSARP